MKNIRLFIESNKLDMLKAFSDDSYLYNLNRTRIVLRILIDVNSFNKNDEEFNRNFNEVIEILNNEIEKEKENEKNIRR